MATRRPDVSPYLSVSGDRPAHARAGSTTTLAASGYVDHDVLAEAVRPLGVPPRSADVALTTQHSDGYVDFDVLETCHHDRDTTRTVGS